MARNSKPRRESFSEARPPRKAPKKFTPTKLRIVAGAMGGRKIEYNGDPATRPMKEKTREAVFSLLGGYLYETIAVDLFGGTGILAFEAISRGSEQAAILEMSRSSVSTIVSNLKLLKLDEQVEVHNVDTLRWLRSLEQNVKAWPDLPWVVFCCPPYRLWVNDGERLADGLRSMYALSPKGSQFVCETDKSYDLATSIPELPWDIRDYTPAFVGVCEKCE
jgi:16S rRNA (guanine966-N2)-methyltransferase